MRRNLTIRAQTFATIGLTFLVLTTALYGLTSWFLESGFGRAEEQDTRRNVARVRAALLDNVARLNTTAGDWACWQDAYDYMAGTNPHFVRDELTLQTVAGVNVHMLVLLRLDGSVKYATGFNPYAFRTRPLPPGMQAHLVPGSLLTRHVDVHSSHTGLLPLAGGVWMIASRPVITSEKRGPIQGTLILGRKMDRAEVSRLTELLDLRFTLDPGPSSQDVAIQRISDGLIIGETSINDLYGKPTLELEVATPRDIWRQGQNSRFYLLISMIVLCTVGSTLTLYLMEKLLLSRVRGLSRQVQDITTRQDFSSRVGTKGATISDSANEILILTAAVNDLLSTVQHSHASLRASESRFRTFMDHSPALAFIKDPQGCLTYVNAAFEQVIGRSREELIGCSDYDLWSANVAAKLRANDQEILRTGCVMQLEERTEGGLGPPQD